MSKTEGSNHQASCPYFHLPVASHRAMTTQTNRQKGIGSPTFRSCNEPCNMSFAERSDEESPRRKGRFLSFRGRIRTSPDGLLEAFRC